jgi:hypothetical protein
MAAIIEVGGKQATIEDFIWKCDDEALERILVAHTQGELVAGYEGYDPNPDYTLALSAIKTFGGTLIKFDEVKAAEGVIY